jgi:hypothetical protein
MSWICRGDFTSTQTQPKVAPGAVIWNPAVIAREPAEESCGNRRKTADVSVLSRIT